MDAEIAFEVANTDRWLSRFDDAIANYEQALRLDPGFAYAAVLESVSLLSRGNPEGAIAVSKRCEASSPGAIGCLKPRMYLENDDGRCSELQDDARKIILRHPDSAAGYLPAAQALYALGSPMSAVRESFAQARSRMGERATWSKEGQLLEVNLETLTGNFSEAEKLEAARETDPSFTGSSDEGMQAKGAWARIEIALEEGELSRAADIAAEHIARSQAWSTEVRDLDEPQFQYAQMIRAVLAHTKRMSPTELEAARAATIASVNTKSEPMAGASLWYALYAAPATTPAEAKVALDVLPQYEPLPPYWYFPADFAIGEVYRLSGNADDAIPHLKRAANACDAIYYPFENTRAHFALGQALEAKQDTAGACAAYAVVAHRWGQAKPRSVTGERTRARMNALKCAP
jgi:serine/threonine-protein kinase